MKQTDTGTDMFVPCATVFFSSACIMIIELVAGRLIARVLGSSLYTWTSIIGVVLAGISIGNYIGGRIADKFSAQRILAVLFGISSAACAVVVIANNVVGKWTWLWQFGWSLRIFCHVSLVFFVPSALLGMISPVVAKMALDKGMATGRTVGSIYAWGAAGSIVGTFAAGYFLISAMGTVAILWSVSAALLLTGILYGRKFWALYVWGVILLCLIFLGLSDTAAAKEVGSRLKVRRQVNPDILYEDETQYCYVAVQQKSKEPDKRDFLQDKLVHSKIAMDDISDLQYFYTKIYRGVTEMLSGNKESLSVMVIGGGGYVWPRYIEAFWPGSHIDVVEIDSGVTRAAYEAFGLSRQTSINTITSDARNYIDELLQKKNSGGSIVYYDFIFEDAINDYSVPFQLVTKEFNDRISEVLAPGGVYVVNLIDIYDSGRFVGAVISTLERTFANVDVLTDYDILESARRTFVIVAGDGEFDSALFTREYAREFELWVLSEQEIEELKDKSRGIILTDDYAPVENLLAPVVRADAKALLAVEYLKEARQLYEQRQWQGCLLKCEEVLKLSDVAGIKAYNQIALVYQALGRLDVEAEVLVKTIEFNQRHGGRKNLAPVHLHLGLIYKRLGEERLARAHLEKAEKLFRDKLRYESDSFRTLTDLGNTLAELNRLDEASKVFEQAISLQPGEAAGYLYLYSTLRLQGRYEEAAECLKDGIRYLMGEGLSAEAGRLRQALQNLQSGTKQDGGP